MPLEVGLVGLPGSGKTSLFRALTGAPTTAGEYGKPHMGMASVPDERVGRLAEVLGSAKATPAVMRVVDPPGLDASVLGELRKVDALIAVSRSFGPDVDAERDAESLALELILADRDHVERRLERVRQQAKSGDPETRKEVASVERALAHVEAGGSLADYPGPIPAELEPLTTKPLVWVVNGDDGIDLALEAELADLPEEEAAAFREGPSALETAIAALFEQAGLITFFTGNEKEARAWTLRSGSTALDAAGAVHTDMARGFIRCEVIGYADLVDAGSRAEAARRGLQRLEGKTYVVADGDVLNVRFNV
jgi:ribosome-binding ATPase YchF (GTP1/OBG family)